MGISELVLARHEQLKEKMAAHLKMALVRLDALQAGDNEVHDLIDDLKKALAGVHEICNLNHWQDGLKEQVQSMARQLPGYDCGEFGVEM